MSETRVYDEPTPQPGSLCEKFEEATATGLFNALQDAHRHGFCGAEAGGAAIHSLVSNAVLMMAFLDLKEGRSVDREAILGRFGRIADLAIARAEAEHARRTGAAQ